ncbi:iron ABC transporter permease [bacterium AH-315-E10]|nr:iron ABC transporter permease [bacterium AH-315-E10]
MHFIYWELRVPRLIIAWLAGAGLAVCGMCFQAFFRNPLTTPFTLGIASGASLGASLYIVTGLSLSFFGISGISIAAFGGACLTSLLVYSFTLIMPGRHTNTLLLAGVAINFFFSSLIICVQYCSGFVDSFKILHWMMGGISVVGMNAVYDLAPFALCGIVVIYLHSNELNLMTTGEEFAVSRGVNVNRAKSILFFASSLTVGGVVAVCGPIGFVGLMAPHTARIIFGPDHKLLSVTSALIGASFLCLSDTVARTILAEGAELPVGLITALVGGPYFLFILIYKMKGIKST